MFRSLRFRLPAIFLAGLVLSGLVSTLIAVRLFQDYAREQTIDELRREAAGIAVLYAENAGRETLSAGALEEATGDRLFYVPFAAGIELFPAQQFGLRPLPPDAVDSAALEQSGAIIVRVHAAERGPRLPRRRVPARDRRHDLSARSSSAKPMTELGERWVTLAQRLALAFLGGLLVAGAARVVPERGGSRSPCSRSRARRTRSRRGSYDVEVPQLHERRRDRAPVGAVRRDGAAPARDRGARAELPHERLARAAHAADRDPGPRRGAARGRRRGSGPARGVARRRRARDGAARAARRRRARPGEARRAPLHGAAGGGRHASGSSTGPTRRSAGRPGGARSTTGRRSTASR